MAESALPDTSTEKELYRHSRLRLSGARLSQLLDRELRYLQTASSGFGRALLMGIALAAVAVSAIGLEFDQEIASEGKSPSSSAAPGSPPNNEVRACLIAHEPIRIVGNSGFEELNSSTGILSGSGSASDPYIIAGWDIDASEAPGISVSDADAYFVIRDCYIHNGSASGHAGIYLENCSHGWVHNNTCVNDLDGIFLEFSDGIIVTGNNCSDDTGGIVLSHSTNIALRDNVMWRNGLSIGCNSLPQSNTHEIEVSNTVNGAPVYFYKNQSNVVVPSGAGEVILANCSGFIVEGFTFAETTHGIIAMYSSNTSLRYNTCLDSVYGIVLQFCTGITIANNTCKNEIISAYSWAGIALFGSCNNTIAGNVCSGGQSGLLLTGSSDGNALFENEIFYNLNGVYLDRSDDNRVSWNALHDNLRYGAVVSLSAGNVIWNNSFSMNNGAGSTYDPSHVQAFEIGFANMWNDTAGYGNCWSDWLTPDLLPPFERVDVPYEVDGPTDSKDYHPLTSFPSLPIPEFDLLLPVLLGMLVVLAVSAARRSGRHMLGP